MNKGEQAKDGLETIGKAALRLLGRLEARKYRAAGSGQAAPIQSLSKSQAMRRLGLSEEKNRRQSPQRVADNDNGRKGPREKQTQNLLPRSRDKLPCRREWEERHGCEKSGRVDFVLRCLRAGGETATSPNRDDVSYTDRTGRKGPMLPVNSK